MSGYLLNGMLRARSTAPFPVRNSCINLKSESVDKCSHLYPPKEIWPPNQIKCHWGLCTLANRSAEAYNHIYHCKAPLISEIDGESGGSRRRIHHLMQFDLSTPFLISPLCLYHMHSSTHTHITSLQSSPLSFCLLYFPSLTHMRSLHWFHPSCYGLGASGRHSSAEQQITSPYRASCPAM